MAQKVKNTDHTQAYIESEGIYCKGAKTALNWYIKALVKGVYLTPQTSESYRPREIVC